MIKITSYGTDYNCSCGDTSIVCLNINGTRMNLCKECIKELTDELNRFNNTTFCYMCKEFIMSESGWNYGGSCKLEARNNNVELKDSDAGYLYCKDCMDSCPRADKI